MKSKSKVALAFVLVACSLGVILFSPYHILPFSLNPSSYTTAYEGAKASFYGADWNERGDVKFTNGQYQCDVATAQAMARNEGLPSLMSFEGTEMNLDVDAAMTSRPNVVGEMTAVMIPNVQNNRPDWVPASWWNDWLGWQEPVAAKTHEWNITNSDGSTTVFHMEEWLTKWDVSFSAKWDSFGLLGSEESKNHINNLQIWFKFDISPTWYFVNQTASPLFAIGKIQLNNCKLYGLDNNGQVTTDRSDCSVTPESSTSILPIFLNPFDTSNGNDAPNSQTLESYQGQTLNPTFFRDTVYSYLTLGTLDVRLTMVFLLQHLLKVMLPRSILP